MKAAGDVVGNRLRQCLDGRLSVVLLRLHLVGWPCGELVSMLASEEWC